MKQVLAFLNPSLSTKNVGDYFISDSVKRILDFDLTHSVDIDPRKPITNADIDLINSADAAVILGTNLWYSRMSAPGRWQFTSEQLRRIRVPIIPFGVGTTRHEGEDNGFDAETLEQLRLIHGSCNIASARDPRTVEALNEAGIQNVAMTGCPTMFRSLRPTWELRPANPTGPVVVTVRKGQRSNVRRLIQILQNRNLTPIVAAQQDGDVFTRRWIPFVQRPVQTLYEYSMAPYLQLLERSRGAIGCRLHGNMLHLAHGNPSILISNCSRGDSFCDAFGLPRIRCEDHHRLSDKQLQSIVESFTDPETFAPVATRYRLHRKTLVEFLDANDLAHRLDTKEIERDGIACRAA